MPWVVFSYSLPSAGRSSPRVAVWRRLRALEAVSPKGGVHVLPARDECVEAFQWLAQEVEQAKGEALLMRVERFEGLSDAQLITLFQEARKEDYAALDARGASLEKTLTGSRSRDPRDNAQARDLLARFRREHAEIARIDFFDSPAGAQVASRLARIEEALSPARPDDAPVAPRRALGLPEQTLGDAAQPARRQAGVRLVDQKVYQPPRRDPLLGCSAPGRGRLRHERRPVQPPREPVHVRDDGQGGPSGWTTRPWERSRRSCTRSTCAMAGTPVRKYPGSMQSSAGGCRAQTPTAKPTGSPSSTDSMRRSPK